jgi:peptidoglycan/xylan/chitin deacetylase (PgdA/CDA1 family)
MATGSRFREDKGVVSLTYDGTLAEHATVALPQLERAGIKATFFAEPAAMLDSVQTWRAAQASGHEIGNGCLLGAALPDGSLPAWTPEMIGEDIDECDRLLADLFPSQVSVSFAYPIGDPKCAGGLDYRPVVERRHDVCRSGSTGTNAPAETNVQRLLTVPVGLSEEGGVFEALEAAAASGAWVVLAFESVEPALHRSVVEWLLARQGDVTVAPLQEAAKPFLVASKPKLRLI